jgi:DNA-nicking Smr family endonuclease
MKMKEEQTIYRAFERLPQLLRDRRIELRATGQQNVREMSPPKQPAVEKDDFLTAMTGVTPIAERNRRVPKNSRKDCSGPASYKPKDVTMDSAMENSYVLNVLNLPEYMEGCAEDLHPLILERLRGGEYSMQRIIDLHGLSAEEAEETFKSFIIDAIQNQVCCVKVIHGRGLKSKRGPVLKEKLKGWIVRAIHRRWVAAFCSAKMSDGGPGATIILLRTRANKKRLHIYG